MRCPGPAARPAARCRASCATAPSCSWMPARPCSSVSCSSLARRLRSAMMARYCCFTSAFRLAVTRAQTSPASGGRGHEQRRAPANAAASTTAARRGARRRRAIEGAGETPAAARLEHVDAGDRDQRPAAEAVARGARQGSWSASNTCLADLAGRASAPPASSTSASSTAVDPDQLRVVGGRAAAPRRASGRGASHASLRRPGG